jgi:predicted TPR repeat methyltransferase
MTDKDKVLNKINLLINAEQFADALSLSAEAAKSSPNEPSYFYYAGVALAAMGKVDLALKYLLHTITIQPLYVAGHLHITRIISSLCDNSKQVAIFQSWVSVISKEIDLEDLENQIFSHFSKVSDAAYWRVVSSFARMYMEIDHVDKALKLLYLTVKDISKCSTSSSSALKIEEEYNSYDYDQNSMHRKTTENFSQFVSPFLKNKSNQVIFDAACGTGHAANYLRPHAKVLIGTDLSPTMVQRAKKKDLYDLIKTGNITEPIKFSDNIDIIHCLGATYYLPSLDSFLSSCSAMLKPGAMLLFSDYPAPPNIEIGITIGPTARHCRSDRKTIALAQNNGFLLSHASFGLVYGIPSRYWFFKRI